MLWSLSISSKLKKHHFQCQRPSAHLRGSFLHVDATIYMLNTVIVSFTNWKHFSHFHYSTSHNASSVPGKAKKWYVPFHPSMGLISQPLWLMLMKRERAWWGSRQKHSIQLCYFCYVNCIKTLSWPQLTGLVYTEVCSELLWASLKADSSSWNLHGGVIECISKREKSLATNYQCITSVPVSDSQLVMH